MVIRRERVGRLACIVGLGVQLSACGSASAPATESTRVGAPTLASARSQVESSSAAATTSPTPAEPAAAPASGAAAAAGTIVIAPGASSGLVDLARSLPTGARAWVGPLAGNGGRDVLVYLPPGGDAKRPLRLVYHFHGTYAEHVEAPRVGLAKKKWVGWDRALQVVEAAAALQAARPWNVAIVYPLSAGPRHEPGAKGMGQKAYDRMWMVRDPANGFDESFDDLHVQVLQRLRDALGVDGTRAADAVIVEGHSAGGIALRNIARSASRRVGDYLFLDASFQGWADGCHAAVTDHGSRARITVVMTENGIADPFGPRDPWCVSMPEQAAAFGTHARWCKGREQETPPGRDESCATLQVAADEWPRAQPWCADYPHDLSNTPGVFLHRTRVFHGEQPRHFVGGLELPEGLPLGRD